MKRAFRGAVRSKFQPGFTLVELMVSMSVITLLMLILLQAVDGTSRIWKRTTSKVSQFQAARAAFEAITRNLSQATLNTYYGVEYNPSGYPSGYYRESELHFVSGKASQSKLLNGDEKVFPTHALFFQAPIGSTAKTAGTSGANAQIKAYRNLNNLLSAVGYYIEFGEDKTVPDPIEKLQTGDAPMIPKRYRFRLMEVIQPAEALSIYATPSFYKRSTYTKTTDWIQVALGKMAPPGGSAQATSWVRAENVVALVILPKLPDRDRTPPGSPNLDLAPKYEYDSRPADASGRAYRKETISSGGLADATKLKQFNQLPPMVQVVMVAIDEPSAARQQDVTGKEPPDWSSGLFKSITRQDDLAEDLGDVASPSTKSLLYRMNPPDAKRQRIDYRVYSADVMLRGSKWTTID